MSPTNFHCKKHYKWLLEEKKNDTGENLDLHKEIMSARNNQVRCEKRKIILFYSLLIVIIYDCDKASENRAKYLEETKNITCNMIIQRKSL